MDELIGNRGRAFSNASIRICNPNFSAWSQGSEEGADAPLAAVLKRRWDIDTLAVMPLLSREAHESQDDEMALYWSGETYYMLLRFGLELHRHGVCPLLVRFFRRHIFAKCTWPGWTFHNQDGEIGLSMGFLAVLEHELPAARRRSADSKVRL